jgi:hypothetical protein
VSSWLVRKLFKIGQPALSYWRIVLGVETGSASNRDLQLDLGTFRTEGLSRRRCPICVVFVHRDAGVVHNCQQKLERAQSSSPLMLFRPWRSARSGPIPTPIMLLRPTTQPSTKGSQGDRVQQGKRLAASSPKSVRLEQAEIDEGHAIC